MQSVHNMLEGGIYKKIIRAQGMRNLIFEIDEVIDEQNDLDVWVIYNTEPGLEKYYSLKKLLWDV